MLFRIGKLAIVKWNEGRPLGKTVSLLRICLQQFQMRIASQRSVSLVEEYGKHGK